jgi:hypothetical protein
MNCSTAHRLIVSGLLVLACASTLSACFPSSLDKTGDGTTEDDDEDQSDASGSEQESDDDNDSEAEDDDTEDEPDPNAPPRVSGVSISPPDLYVDGEARCNADVADPDGDAVSVSYQWRNESRGTSLGSGQRIELSPQRIMPGERLSCAVVAEDPSGAADRSDASIEAICGLSDLDSLSDMSAAVTIHFRPWTTDELQPGWGGTPWDWNGSIPEEVFNLANDLDLILTLVSLVYPAPEVLTAQEIIDQLIEIGYLVDSTAPVLLAPHVPPDADIFPYMLDDEGYMYPFWDHEDGGLRWEDSYEVEVTAEHLDLATYSVFALDMEDVDIAIDDNMGDYVDHADYPLMLSWMLFAEGAYCTSTIYNPTDYAQSSEVAYVPSSILYMAVDVY